MVGNIDVDVKLGQFRCAKRSPGYLGTMFIYANACVDIIYADEDIATGRRWPFRASLSPPLTSYSSKREVCNNPRKEGKKKRYRNEAASMERR
jgi:hypothetical protein